MKDMENEIKFDRYWQSTLENMGLELSKAVFESYIKPLRLLGFETQGSIYIVNIGCPSEFIRQRIEQRFTGQLISILNRVSKLNCEIKLSTNPKIKGDESAQDLPLFSQDLPTKTLHEHAKSAGLQTHFVFNSFAVSGSNQMAYAAASAVANQPGQAYNPLFIYGGVGVGKTHLMQAIGHELIKKGESRILFCTGEEFTNDLVEGIQRKSTDKVRAKYRRVKLLLIDDVQFIAGKATIQEEFFHTFNAILKEGGQVVMTSDKPPAEINKLETRLKSRFSAGLIVDIGPADFELRTAILLIKAKQKNIDLSIESAKVIAEKVVGARELEGALTRLVLSTDLTEDSALRLFGKTGKASSSAKIVTPNDIFNSVSETFGVGVGQLKGERRTKSIVWPRQILMYLLHKELNLSLDETGRLVGGRDHSTVIHASDKVKMEIEHNTILQMQIKTIMDKVLISG
jgi:chromosomal replication initiator protein